MKSQVKALFFILFFIQVNIACGGQKIHSSEKEDVKHLMQQVADWQIKNFSYKKEGNLHDYGIDAWTNATLYVGMLEWAKISDNSKRYLDWLRKIGSENNWKMPANFKEHPKYSLYHADELCMGQFYLGMYNIYMDPSIIQATRERLDWIIDNPGNKEMNYKNKQSWTWCDALFMAPPVYAQMYGVTNDIKYLDFMYAEFERTYDHLYDKKYNLFFRDDSFFDKKEANGEKIFWGRGNGWVAAGLVNILKALPQESYYRKFYQNLFVEFVSSLIKYQDEDGFWHASLLDPASYPSPETSATALITYALAYGVNEDLLKGEEYKAAANKGWSSLMSVVDADGKLGFVQPIGADPKKVTADMTAVYGVGAFLLAGSEMYELIHE